MTAVHLDQQIVLILDDDLSITEALASGLERHDRTVITCNDLESAQMIVERLSPSHIVSDVRLSGPFGFEGLDFIRYAKRHSPSSRIILMTGDAPEALQMEASERGAVAFLQKPFEVRELDSVIDLMWQSARGESERRSSVIRWPLLDEILLSSDLRPVFQPIVQLRGSRPVFGYEALARYRSESPLRNPEMLFQYAKRKQRLAELEISCVSKSLESGVGLASSGPLFLNIHPHVFGSGRFREVLISEAQRCGLRLEQIVLEITEQASLTDDPRALENIERLHKLGVRFAFDDVGVAYSHLPFIDKVRPSFLKISQHFGTGFESDPTKTKIVRNLLSLAHDFNSELILEGIEAESTARAAEEIGINLGQGYFFARPGDASAFVAA